MKSKLMIISLMPILLFTYSAIKIYDSVAGNTTPEGIRAWLTPHEFAMKATARNGPSVPFYPVSKNFLDKSIQKLGKIEWIAINEIQASELTGVELPGSQFGYALGRGIAFESSSMPRSFFFGHTDDVTRTYAVSYGDRRKLVKYPIVFPLRQTSIKEYRVDILFKRYQSRTLWDKIGTWITN